MPVNLTPEQAKAMGVTPAEMKRLGIVTKRKRTTRHAAHGAYRTVCTTCLLEFNSAAAEDRHVAPGHNRFELVLE